MNYAEFAVRVSPGAGNRYGVSIACSEGSCESTLQLPFRLDDLEGVVRGVSRALRGTQGPSRDIPPAAQAETARRHAARDFGVSLYRALFRDNVQSLLDRTLGSSRGKAGVRVRLQMDLLGEGMAEAASLPWELMACDRTELPLVMSRKTVLVRSLDVLHPGDPIPFEPPLRILTVISNPRGTAALQLDEERARIQKSWGRLPGVRVDFERPCFRQLLDRLAAEDYHVIHFMGHGDFDRQTGRGTLLLEHEDGSPDAVDSDRLKVLLGDEPLLRLVFLNSCLSGATSQVGFDPFSGIAASLIRIGVPAVVAMQFPISDRGAIDFSDSFYRRITDGYPVDAAVTEGRKVLWGKAYAEWATPVLFMRSSNGVLFESAREPRSAGSMAATRAMTAGEAAVVAATLVGKPLPPASVFLAAPSDQLRPMHRQLTADLKSSGIIVVSDVPPPYAEADHAATVLEHAKRSSLCVHLLGDRPGEPMDLSSQSRTYTLEQLRIALESARSQLVLMPDQVDPAGLADQDYAQIVRSLSDRPRQPHRFELVRTGSHQMLDEVLAKLSRLEQAGQQTEREVSGHIETVFVDMHASDFVHASDLISHLALRRITPIMMPSGGSTPAAAVSLFEENLQKVPLFLVVFGSVAREWVLGRLNAAVRVVTTHGVRVRIGVYIAPPEKNAEVLRFPPFYDVAANMTGFNPSTVDALIDLASETTA